LTVPDPERVNPVSDGTVMSTLIDASVPERATVADVECALRDGRRDPVQKVVVAADRDPLDGPDVDDDCVGSGEVHRRERIEVPDLCCGHARTLEAGASGLVLAHRSECDRQDDEDGDEAAGEPYRCRPRMVRQ
jgi:hypothetical protein